MKCSLHSLITFLPLFCNCQLSSIPLLTISYSGRLASRNSTPFLSNWLVLNATLHGPRRKQPLYCWRGVFTAPLHRFGSYSTVACVFVAAGTCLESLPRIERLFLLRYAGFRASRHNIIKHRHWWRTFQSRSFSYTTCHIYDYCIS
jgi:hypothetical protein